MRSNDRQGTLAVNSSFNPRGTRPATHKHTHIFCYSYKPKYTRVQNVHSHTCIHTYTDISKHKHTLMFTHTDAQIDTHRQINTRMNTPTHTHINTQTNTHRLQNTHTHTDTPTRTHTLTHIRAHTHTCTRTPEGGIMADRTVW